MNNQVNTQLFRAFIEPILYDIIEERVENILTRKLQEVRRANTEEKPLQVKEVCDILGLSKSHIYTLCKRRKMPHFRKGGRYYFYLSMINSWLKKD